MLWSRPIIGAMLLFVSLRIHFSIYYPIIDTPSQHNQVHILFDHFWEASAFVHFVQMKFHINQFCLALNVIVYVWSIVYLLLMYFGHWICPFKFDRASVADNQTLSDASIEVIMQFLASLVNFYSARGTKLL